jgi:predicted membrane protein
MEPNDRFKIPISLLSIATITVAAILLTIFVMNHEHVQPGVEAVLIFAVIFFGPVTLLCVLFIEGWPIDIGTLISVFALPTSALAALLAASLHSRYSASLRRAGWFLWVLCCLMVAGSFIRLGLTRGLRLLSETLAFQARLFVTA